MNKFLDTDIIKLSKKRTSNVFGEAAAGATAGAVGTAILTPFSNVIDKIVVEHKAVPWKRFMPELMGEIKRLDTWTKIVPLKAMKMGATLGLTFGGVRLLKNLFTKKASIYSDLKIPKPKFKSTSAPRPETKPAKLKKERWTPMNTESRFVWSQLDPQQKRAVNDLMKNMSPRVRGHNKDVMINELGKGRNFKNLVKRIQDNPNIVL